MPRPMRRGHPGRGGERRHGREPRGVGQPTPHEVVVGPGVVEPEVLGGRPQRGGLAPRHLGKDRDTVPQPCSASSAGDAGGLGSVPGRGRGHHVLPAGSAGSRRVSGSRASRCARVPLTRSRPPASASAHAQVARREPQPRLGIRLHDVRRGAAGVGGTLDALHRPERRHPHLDASARCPGAELLEGVAHGRAARGAVDTLGVGLPRGQCCPARGGVGASAGRHTGIVGAPCRPVAGRVACPGGRRRVRARRPGGHRGARRSGPVGRRPRRPGPTRLRVRAAPRPVRRRARPGRAAAVHARRRRRAHAPAMGAPHPARVAPDRPGTGCRAHRGGAPRAAPPAGSPHPGAGRRRAHRHPGRP